MVFQELYLRRYLSDRKVLVQFRYVLVLNRSKITLTDPADTMGTAVTSQAIGRTGRFRAGLPLGPSAPP